MAIYAVCAGFILFDILTGILKAVKDGSVNSSVLREGLFHKAAEILLVIGAGALEYASPYISLPEGLPMLGAAVTYICVMETVSIVENLCAVNPGLANLFSNYLQKAKKE